MLAQYVWLYKYYRILQAPGRAAATNAIAATELYVHLQYLEIFSQ
jgi:hypothetical protein